MCVKGNTIRKHVGKPKRCNVIPYKRTEIKRELLNSINDVGNFSSKKESER